MQLNSLIGRLSDIKDALVSGNLDGLKEAVVSFNRKSNRVFINQDLSQMISQYLCSYLYLSGLSNVHTCTSM